MPTNNPYNPQPHPESQPGAAQQQFPTPPTPPMPMMPPPKRVQPAAHTWQQRMMRNYGMGMYAQLRKGELTIPDWLVGRPIVVFFVALFACWAAFGYVPGADLVLTACISIVLFFYVGYAMSRGWERANEKRFLRNVFLTGLFIRVLWVLYCYFVFNPDHYETTYGDGADVTWYMPFAQDLARWVGDGFDVPFSEMRERWGAAIDDVGYPIWLAVGYLIWGDVSDVFMPLMVKCVIGAYCAICMYNVAKRHYGDGVARVAAIFICLNPNMIYWCGCMFKEAEMVFLCCLAVDNFDRVLSSGKQYTFRTLLPGVLAALALMFFRTALGLVMFLAVFAHIVMASRRVMSMGKKILAGVLVASVLLVSMGDRIRTQSQELLSAAQSDSQSKNMEWRSHRTGGNSFAKYATATVFAPLIFTIPFPTFNRANENQLLQVQLSGGYYIKNILSFFVVVVMLLLLVSGEWRKHVFILAYTVGYLMVLVMSSFAQSGRFHMPIWPMLMLFAAYGVQIAKGNARLRRGFAIVLVVEIFACIAWNWFKLAGRGMI